MNPEAERALREAVGVFGDLFNRTVPRTFDRFEHAADPILAFTAPIFHWATSTTPILRDRLHGKKVTLGEPITRVSILKYLGISYYALQALTILNWSIEKIWDIGGKIIEHGASVEDASIIIPISVAALTIGSAGYEVIRPVRWLRNTRRENQRADLHDAARAARERANSPDFEPFDKRKARQKREDEQIQRQAHRNVLLVEVSEIHPFYDDMMRAYDSGDRDAYLRAFQIYQRERGAIPGQLTAEVEEILEKRFAFDKAEREQRRRKMSVSFGKRVLQAIKKEEPVDERIVRRTWEQYFLLFGK